MRYSFIIPAYNCRDYLSGCVESILTVGVEDHEILLIDDGSTDGTGCLCDALAEQYSGIRVIHQANAGASAARNRGIQEASGEWILFFDADDSIHPEALREVLADPRCAEADLVIFGLTFDYYRRGNCYRRDSLYYPFNGILSKQDWGSAFWELFACNSWSPVWNKVFRRDILLENNLHLNTAMFLYEDFEFVLRYLQHCDRIWNVPQAVYHYRQSEDEGNAKRRLRRVDSLPIFLEPIEAALAELCRRNPAVEKPEAGRVLQQLYLTLAREKISVSDLGGIRRICREFSQWAEDRNLSMGETELQRNLLQEKAVKLFLTDKKSSLRHCVAVWVKSHLYKIREEKHGCKE